MFIKWPSKYGNAILKRIAVVICWRLQWSINLRTFLHYFIWRTTFLVIFCHWGHCTIISMVSQWSDRDLTLMLVSIKKENEKCLFCIFKFFGLMPLRKLIQFIEVWTTVLASQWSKIENKIRNSYFWRTKCLLCTLASSSHGMNMGHHLHDWLPHGDVSNYTKSQSSLKFTSVFLHQVDS